MGGFCKIDGGFYHKISHMSTISTSLLNQTAGLIIDSKTSTSQGDLNPINQENYNPSDYLFILVTYFKESNSLPVALLHQLQCLAELTEREVPAINVGINPIYTGSRTSSRYIRFNDFFISNFQ